MLRLWIGPPGSGKTTRVLEEVRARLRRRRGGFRLLAPTSTMAEHLRNQLAREGFLFRPSLVTTLHGFVDSFEGLPPLAGPLTVPLALDAWLDSACPAPFRPLLGTPGLRRAIEAALDELTNAGCDSLQLEALAGLGLRLPLLDALRAGLAAAEEALAREGTASRTARLLAAARAPRPPAGELFVDGFFQFLPAEIALLTAAAAHMPVTVTLPAWPGAAASREAFLRAGARETNFRACRPEPAAELVEASSREAEVFEIARLLLDEHRRGRAWMEMGVVMRSERPYAPLVETTFARLGIPVRSYFARPLRLEPSTTALSGWLGTAAAGFEAGAVLRCLRHPALPFSSLPRWPEIERAVRERLPFTGLDSFLRLAAEPALDVLREWTDAATAVLPPAGWAARLSRLSGLVVGPGAAPALSPVESRLWQRRASALRSWRGALDSVVASLGAEPVTVQRFARDFDSALETATLLPSRSGGRDCVHLLGVYEARQWELPVVMVCGLVEGEFPAHEPADPLLGDDLRLRLRRQGLPLVLASDRRLEETFLLDLALSRATERLMLSWPRFDAKGDPVQRSYALDRFTIDPRRPPPVDIRPARQPSVPPASILESPGAREALAARYAVQRPTWIEAFLQCPFLFFSRHTLELSPPPGGLLDRLSPLELGSFAHELLDAWHRACISTGRMPPMPEMFDRAWTLFLNRHRIPDGFPAESARASLRRGLLRFAANPRFRDGWTVETEMPFRLELPGVALAGRIDRIDRSPANHVILFDFKLTGESGLRDRIKKHDDGALVQGGLYAKALAAQGAAVDAVYYVPLRSAADPRGWDEPDVLHELMEQSARQAARAQFEILQGKTAPAPLDESRCASCDFLTACRWTSAQPQAESAAG